MKVYILIFLVLLTIFAESQISVSVPVIDKLKAEIVKLSEDADMKNASIGFYAIDLKDNSVIADYNADMSLVPASTMKVLTTASALEILGSGFRFKTIVEYTGAIDTVTGILNGNLYIKGGGDPCLGSASFKKNYFEPFFMEVWKDSVKSAEIKKISGHLVADVSMFKQNSIPANWVWGDIANYYGTSPNALSIYENTYKLTYKSGANSGDSTVITAIEPENIGLEIDNYVISSNSTGDNAYIYGCPYDNYRYVEGTIPKNRSEFIVKGSIPYPHMVAAGDFLNILTKDSIVIEKGIVDIFKADFVDTLARIEICKTLSPTLGSIVTWTNLRSQNLFAEHLLFYLGYSKYRSADNVSGSNAVTDFWKEKGMDTDGLYMNDGSGLSRYNGVTAKQLCWVMKYMNTSKNKDVFKKSLPVAGVSGTLSGFCDGTVAENRVSAKSGTMTRVKSYAGYAKTIDNKELAFAIIVNNFNCSPAIMNSKIEKLIISLVEY